MISIFAHALGICYHDCKEDHIQVPYGTNLPGQTICYRQQRPGSESFVEVRSCAPQLTQTAHHALQLPYTIFGLGMAPNFLDYMYVNVTNTSSHSIGRTWTQVPRTKDQFQTTAAKVGVIETNPLRLSTVAFQIIPNSQMYIIPYPRNWPTQWEAKLYITPSRGITLTALALVGTCILCVLIILALHWRERAHDRKEKLQEANRFHFDAM